MTATAQLEEGGGRSKGAFVYNQVYGYLTISILATHGKIITNTHLSIVSSPYHHHHHWRLFGDHCFQPGWVNTIQELATIHNTLTALSRHHTHHHYLRDCGNMFGISTSS
ncbi:hypothetical protein E2C01_058404 [Portunus trituberculatus]|uniref:Uncharacterized protein n=1 Tax=Portunus trituberculatus TaxID=210409 RepID=A0A5B7GZR2_PORTR|nr:hypothetical protein [Portunus trituberculatus]